jgi:hypothetical protein
MARATIAALVLATILLDNNVFMLLASFLSDFFWFGLFAVDGITP